MHELFPAIQAAEKAVSLNPHWYIAHQTLGRAQMSYGDVEMVSQIMVITHKQASNGGVEASLLVRLPLDQVVWV